MHSRNVALISCYMNGRIGALISCGGIEGWTLLAEYCCLMEAGNI